MTTTQKAKLIATNEGTHNTPRNYYVHLIEGKKVASTSFAGANRTECPMDETKQAPGYMRQIK